MRRRQFFQGLLGLAAVGGVAACASRQSRDVAPTDAETFASRRRFAATPFGRIAYVERGSGPAALFLHGFPLNGFQWRGQLDRLASHRRCIAPDFMGLGFTEVTDGQSVAPAAQAEMLGALLHHLQVDTVDVVANDSGGAVAQLFVLRYPGRVRTMLLTNCDVEPDSPPPALKPVLDLAREGKFADSWLAPWLADKNLARSEQGLGGMTFTFPQRLADATIDCYLGPLVSSPQRKALLHAYALGLDPNPLAGIESALRKCTVPTRIVWGTGDTIFSPASPDYLDRLLPASRGVRRVDGAKLFFPEEYPDLIAQEARGLWGVL